ncbi:uncharacterized protein LOC131015636, partial [Salvia miltiorrhiza]|uniref:uncharacterized protein LOC131015636 n=1 Tax=Salvia miltiorrhiza TaxID=226208 RepID=UPI0025ACB8DF
FISLICFRVEANVSALTNFEVLDLLRSRGAGRDASRAIATVSQSEFKVFDYLEGTVACNQTSKIIGNFVEECQKFDLAKAKILNIRPRSEPKLFPGPSSWRMLYSLDMNSDKGILLAADNFGLLYMMSTSRSSRALTSQASASIRRVVSGGYPTGSG